MIDTISIIGIIFFAASFVISLWANIFLLRRLLHFSEVVDSLLYSLGEYRKHLDSVLSLELYYGDETLQNLLEHSSDVVNEMNDFKSKYERAESEYEISKKEEAPKN